MKEKYLEQKVGAFVLAGLIVIAILVLTFGRFGQVFKSTYDIIAEFPNASGIIKNSQVLYRGAKVGIVPDIPRIARGGESVEIILRIHHSIQIPRNAKIQIGTYGLLGDRYVDVTPPARGQHLTPAEEAKGKYLLPDEHVKGEEAPSVGDFLQSASQKLERFDAVIRDLQMKILTPEFIDDFHDGMKNAKNVLKRGDKLLAQAEKGHGLVHSLLSDKETAMNFKQLVYNLRVSGVLFYHDYTGEMKERKKEEREKEKKEEEEKERKKPTFWTKPW